MYNKVTLIGNLGNDAQIKTLDSGTKVAEFSLATSESYRDKSGEWQQQTEWHNIKAWGKLADRAEKLAKGATILLEGKVTTETWEKDGQKRYKGVIVASYFRILNRSEKTNSSEPLPNPDQSRAEGPDSLPF
jgi:single-strand DNA-binding protein